MAVATAASPVPTKSARPCSSRPFLARSMRSYVLERRRASARRSADAGGCTGHSTCCC
jgi:hypothetical protein